VRSAVADAAATADEVAQATGESARVVAATLAELELLGVVEEVDGVYRAVVKA
jgi:predicted Rossmann fold nucleotide-binding protein DprA/Smf involved in DNA uptake